MAENSLSPQFGNELGGIDWSQYRKPKEPHQMTPDEFASHPYAVFHGTNESPDFFSKVTNDPEFASDYGNFRRHYGTEQAANEILASKVVNYDEGDSFVKNARVYTYWHEPRQSQVTSRRSSTSPRLKPVYDAVANQVSGNNFGLPEKILGKEEAARKELKKNKSLYYTNDHEDVGSVSLVASEPTSVKSQADYVKEAIESGKGHEVHPTTMAMYKSGQLSKPYKVTKDMAYKVTDIGEQDDYITDLNKETKFQPYLPGGDPKSNPKEFLGGEPGELSGGSWPKPERISDRGPDLNKTAAEFKRRKLLS
jgi:hypothetical protein